MHHPYRSLLVGLFLFVTFATGAQTFSPATEKTKWHMAEINPPNEFGYGFRTHYPYGDYVLTASETEKIVPVVVGKNEWGVAMMTKEGLTKWMFNEDKGDLLGLSYLGQDVLAIVTNNIENMKEVTAVLLDAKKGTEKSRKLIYDPSSRYMRIRVLNYPDGKFGQLLCLKTEKKLEASWVAIEEGLKITGPVSLETGLKADEFAGAVMDASGQVYMAALTEDNFEVMRFDRGGKIDKRITTPLEHRGQSQAGIIQPMASGKGVWVALHYDASKKETTNVLIRADFGSGKIAVSEKQELNREFATSANLLVADGAKEGSFRNVDAALPTKLFEYGNKIYLLTEIRDFDIIPNGMNSIRNEMRRSYHNEAWMICQYNDQLKLTSVSGVDRSLGSFLPSGLSMGLQVDGSKATVLSPALRGAGKYALIVSQVDLETGKVTKSVTYDEFDTGGASIVEAGATLWFAHSYLVEKISGKLLSKVIGSEWIKVAP